MSDDNNNKNFNCISAHRLTLTSTTSFGSKLSERYKNLPVLHDINRLFLNSNNIFNNKSKNLISGNSSFSIR